jgi:hypothetical protein
MNPTDVVIKFAGLLERAGIPFMIVGAFSSNIYGIERNTQDADVVVQLSVEGMRHLTPLLKPDFRLDPQMAFEGVASMTRYYVVAHVQPYFKIEVFLLNDDAFSRGEFQRRRQLLFHGLPLYFCSAEDLVVTKLKWFRGDPTRGKDIEDVRGVLAVQGDKLDLVYIRRWCDQQGTRELLDKVLRSIPPIPDEPPAAGP